MTIEKFKKASLNTRNKYIVNAFKRYQLNSHGITSIMRTGKSVISTANLDAYVLSYYFSHYRSKFPLRHTLYRGVSDTSILGANFTDRAVSSWSRRIRVAREFAGNNGFILMMKSSIVPDTYMEYGTTKYTTPFISQYKYEKEVVLPPMRLVLRQVGPIQAANLQKSTNMVKKRKPNFHELPVKVYNVTSVTPLLSKPNSLSKLFKDMELRNNMNTN